MKIIATSFALAYATSSTVSANSDSDTCSNLSYAYPNDIPWVDYQGDDYIFTRQKYNSVCVDSQGKQFEYGAIQGVYTPIDKADGGCSTVCVEGPSVDAARGCNQLPPSNKLVGFQYDCESASCKCLYEAGTLGNQYSKCFDDMNTSYQGAGQVSSTQPQQGETCYSLQIQSNNPPPSPTPPDGTGICTYAPDYDCYQTGHPACCSENDGEDCPDYLTMCDNHAEDEGGFDYCTNAPDYDCYSDGQPSCCSEPGGSFMNCPKEQPACDEPDTPPDGTGICTYAPDYDCYKTGHPACCTENAGEDCPDYLTMCDNHAEDEGGFDYCTNAPDYDCYSDGQPSCCSEPGGSFMNCPQEQPECDDDGPSQYMTMKYLRSRK